MRSAVENVLPHRYHIKRILFTYPPPSLPCIFDFVRTENLSKTITDSPDLCPSLDFLLFFQLISTHLWVDFSYGCQGSCR
ncbi:hypothetical protein L2E82_32662 [Cichorium intybus]|uniref:Uncharacterized protein n=1 Tax=Cichorium intybus TaxID=13427 RepID=A0ACB9BJ32_CICIN|nr:hypothetical protein L2E82_32662 [Cichorium intybus]